jgi:hypothetical protein
MHAADSHAPGHHVHTRTDATPRPVVGRHRVRRANPLHGAADEWSRVTPRPHRDDAERIGADGGKITPEGTLLDQSLHQRGPVAVCNPERCRAAAALPDKGAVSRRHQKHTGAAPATFRFDHETPPILEEPPLELVRRGYRGAVRERIQQGTARVDERNRLRLRKALRKEKRAEHQLLVEEGARRIDRHAPMDARVVADVVAPVVSVEAVHGGRVSPETSRPPRELMTRGKRRQQFLSAREMVDRPRTAPQAWPNERPDQGSRRGNG